MFKAGVKWIVDQNGDDASNTLQEAEGQGLLASTTLVNEHGGIQVMARKRADGADEFLVQILEGDDDKLLAMVVDADGNIELHTNAWRFFPHPQPDTGDYGRVMPDRAG